MNNQLDDIGNVISRQAAIDALYKMLHDCFWADDEELDAVITTLNDLPSAKPERKSGENPDHGYMWICPECGLEVHSDFEKCVRCGYDRERKKGKWILITDNNGQHYVCNHCGEWRYHQGQKFCGECGADMREEGEKDADVAT